MNLESIFQSFPEITTQNLVLRRMQSQDTKALFKIMSDDQVTKYYDDETFQDISQARNQIKAWETGYQARRCIRWGITRIGMSSVIGTCGYYGFHTWHMRAGIGYELARPFWRRGNHDRSFRRCH
jgi:ribosomal-protein-alanine N-acetyltransferase